MPGISGHRWFIILIDDNTRFMWVHLMKSKSEVPNIILKFCEMIQNQFDTKIKRFRSDNAREYFSGHTTTYFERHGIVHQSSCVNTPQQNGLAERRIGLVLATAWVLLFQGKVPKYLW